MTDVWIVTASDGQQNAPDEVYPSEQAAEVRATELVVSKRFRLRPCGRWMRETQHE
jgi:hypothetical protein